jgi:cell division topological specificity factor
MELKEVFEPVLNFIKNFQKKDKEITSKQAAKDRLKLVLMQDRASVSPDFFEMMKQEIIDVIKKYIEIDEDALEVELTRGLEAGLEGPALYANIPIKNVKPVAPKAEGEDETDELILDDIAPLSEAEADVVADKILAQIEESVKADILDDQIVGGDATVVTTSTSTISDETAKKVDEEVPGVINDVKDEDFVKEEKTTTKKRVTKATTTKKKTTAKTAAKAKTTKKKKEE